jgi:hypothetical protein
MVDGDPCKGDRMLKTICHGMTLPATKLNVGVAT